MIVLIIDEAMNGKFAENALINRLMFRKSVEETILKKRSDGLCPQRIQFTAHKFKNKTEETICWSL